MHVTLYMYVNFYKGTHALHDLKGVLELEKMAKGSLVQLKESWYYFFL